LVAAVKLAVTGGTGFVGSHLIDAALAEGHSVTALTRRARRTPKAVNWIKGDLADNAALARLASGADAIIHVAGVLNARDSAGFEAGNVAGTAAMLDAARHARVKRFVFVSSLAAREPDLSLYGSSKACAEALVEASSLDWSIVRPPAVYGPGDKETLDLFRMARRGLIVMPPPGRASYIHVDDLARLLLALAAPGAPARTIIEPDDGRPGGWSHRTFGAALAQAVGRSARVIHVSSALLSLGARIDRLVRGDKAKLTPDRASYFAHPDWTVDSAKAPPAALWHPRIATIDGLRATADWYCAKGWL
jgi:nucleoside-diphosphate-sugar epimerase